MITVEKLEKGTYFDDAFKISFRYDPTTVAKVKELAERRYLPEDRAWEIPAHELPALIEKIGLRGLDPVIKFGIVRDLWEDNGFYHYAVDFLKLLALCW